MKDIERKWQEKWQDAKIFESSPAKKDKFFMTVPYPYISGSLHIGHARVVTEADVFTRYQKMLGRNILYPMAFHVSGTPILGISLAIKNGDEQKISVYRDYVKRYVGDEKKVEKTVKSFEDPEAIVEFFIPKMIQEFQTLGLAIDWRRSYTSADIAHQALVEWQFRKYKQNNYLIRGKYPILFSKTLNNAVGEDDISEGDTNPVEVQEFTLIKFKFGDSYLVAATLRPETMYGQTNMWANPDIEYVKAKVSGETWIVSKECAEKLKYQDKKIELVGKISGKELVGKTCFAPFVEREIMILPSMHCNPAIGTGIVTSVPSDAPFDYVALKELQDSAELCKKHGLNHDAIKAVRLIPIIESKGYGEFPAVEICKKLGITKLSQHEKLAEATQEIYKAGFHTGIMRKNCGKYAGMPVSEAKEGMKKELLDKKKADMLYETSRQAKSRDGGEVIVAVLDGQWFLDFNAKGWKDKTRQLLDKIELWPDKYRKQFSDVLDWLDKRPCARMRGLGTKLPFDDKWVIESLSDSTIYMSLYPIIHLIRENKMKKKQLCDEFFDYIMNSKGKPEDVAKKVKVSSKTLKEMHEEFNYWYPFDHRHTFTAHLSNHLSFMLFAHTACFEKKNWPKRISFHGMIISEGEKMSKSKGNVITLLDINERFGADPFRAFMCNSTSVESTFNWETEMMTVMKTHLDSLLELISGIHKNRKGNIDRKKFASFISKTERAIMDAGHALDKMDLRVYSSIVLYEMLTNYKKVLRTATPEELSAINEYLHNKWTAVLTPLIPHIAEELWSMSNKTFVSEEKWPSYDKKLIDEEEEALEDAFDTLKEDISMVMKLAKLDKLSEVKIFIAEPWKYELFKHIQKSESKNPGELIKSLMATDLRKYGQEIIRLVPRLIGKTQVISDAKVEKAALEKAKDILSKEFNCKMLIESSENSKEPKAKQAMPGKPAILVK